MRVPAFDFVKQPGAVFAPNYFPNIQDFKRLLDALVKAGVPARKLTVEVPAARMSSGLQYRGAGRAPLRHAPRHLISAADTLWIETTSLSRGAWMIVVHSRPDEADFGGPGARTDQIYLWWD